MTLQPPSLGSRDVDEFLLSFHDVSVGEREGYLQRLRNMTRLGFPAGVSIGKGHPARYSADQFFQLLAATELYRCHVPPKLAVELVKSSWSAMRASILEVWDSVDAGEHGKLLELPRRFWRVPAEGGQRMIRTESAGQAPMAERIVVIERSDIDAEIDDGNPLTHCHIFIDVSKLIRFIFMHLKWGGTLMTPDQIACFMSGMARRP